MPHTFIFRIRILVIRNSYHTYEIIGFIDLMKAKKKYLLCVYDVVIVTAEFWRKNLTLRIRKFFLWRSANEKNRWIVKNPIFSILMTPNLSIYRLWDRNYKIRKFCSQNSRHTRNISIGKHNFILQIQFLLFLLIFPF